jgi:shikimate kinase
LQGGNIKNKIEQLHQVRHPIYTEMADFIVDTGVQSALDICQQIEQLIKATPTNKT